MSEERFNVEGIPDPAGEWELCGCGDLIPLGTGKCENCRIVDEMLGVDP